MPRPRKLDDIESHTLTITFDGRLSEMIEDAAAWGKCSLTSAVLSLIEWGYGPYMAFFMDDLELKKMIHKRARSRPIEG